ncbi:MAG: DUF5597 domain-containing protein [Bacteroidales bacterium]|nr:DUF5597 domain-containing protein [Bacteroidales bacterium]
MKKIFTLSLLITFTYLSFAQETSIPRLEKQGDAIKLIVSDRPFLILGGELHNSSTSGTAYMSPIWEKMRLKNLNTVIAPVYWELLEPEEGKFDFTLVDSMIEGARKQDLKLVLLWFASWKNGYSMYAPGWVKLDQKKYPRAVNRDGESFQMLSAFGKESMKADARAFRALMKHIRETDAGHQTVITVQIENEMGLFMTDRDYCEAANKAFTEPVPGDLMKYLTENRGNIQPEIDSVWKANGYKKSGKWEEVFGKSIADRSNWKVLSSLTEEFFTVYHYAKYIEMIASEGKKEYPLPMYVNAWIKQPNGGYPGKYPNGGPVPHTLDIWRAAAPSVDFLAPDIYVPVDVAKYTIEQYHRPGNPVFIPEFRHGDAGANFAFWAYGNHDAIAFAPFGIDDWAPEDDEITKVYSVLGQLSDLILQHQGKKSMCGIYLDTVSPVQKFELGGFRIEASLGGGYYAAFPDPAARSHRQTSAGGMIFSTGPDEFIVAGKNFRLTFVPVRPDPKRKFIDVEFMDEGTFVNGSWVTTRRLNGDEGTGGGDYGFGTGRSMTSGRLNFQPQPGDEYSIIRFRMYRYR